MFHDDDDDNDDDDDDESNAVLERQENCLLFTTTPKPEPQSYRIPCKRTANKDGDEYFIIMLYI